MLVAGTLFSIIRSQKRNLLSACISSDFAFLLPDCSRVISLRSSAVLIVTLLRYLLCRFSLMPKTKIGLS